MEHSLPPVAPPEPSFEPDTPEKKRSRWHLFDVFKKREEPEETEVNQSSPELAPAKRRRFGNAIMRFLRRSESTKPEAEPDRHEQPKPAASQPEALPTPPLIERAHELGRGVLKLLTRVKREVVAADTSEHVAEPTNTQPLTEADERVRAAMQELIAPIEAYAAEHGIADNADTSPDYDIPEVAAEPALALASDGERPLFNTRLPMFDAAMSVATAAAEYVSDSAEYHRERRSRLGLFAVGAATVGVLVYNWRRQRELRKEHRALQKEHKRFEREMAAQQQEDRRRIEQLEQVRVADLSQLQRQEHVYAVSRFANTQAEAIQTVARNRERPVQPGVQAVERPPIPSHQLQPSLRYEAAPQPVFQEPVAERTIRTLAEAPHRTAPERHVRQPEHRSVIERSLDAVRSKTRVAAEPAGAASGLGGLASMLMGLTTGKTADEPPATRSSVPQAPPRPRRRTNQEWLLGISLAMGVVGVVLLLMNVL